jgi:hypothetical protein
MAKREKLPLGLYRRRKRDGTPGNVLWCWYRPHGSKRAVQLSTGTSDIEEAKRFLYARLAEDPKARAARIDTARVTVSDALVLLKKDRDKRGTATERAVYSGLRQHSGILPSASFARCISMSCASGGGRSASSTPSATTHGTCSTR